MLVERGRIYEKMKSGTGRNSGKGRRFKGKGFTRMTKDEIRGFRRKAEK